MVEIRSPSRPAQMLPFKTDALVDRTLDSRTVVVLQMETPAAEVEAAISLARRNGARVILLNLAPRAGWAEPVGQRAGTPWRTPPHSPSAPWSAGRRRGRSRPAGDA